MAPFDDERFEHQHRVEIAHGDGSKIDAQGTNAHRETAEHGHGARS
jgi:hypothetical protein